MAVTILGAKYRDRNTIDPLRAAATATAASPVVTGVSGNASIDPATTGSVQPVGQSGYTLVMSEEFGGTLTVTDAPTGRINFRSGGALWKAWYANELFPPNFLESDAHTNNPGTEHEWYDPSRISLSAGVMRFTAVKDNVHTAAGMEYTSGFISSHPSFHMQYGYFEARILMTGTDGSWPAFWIIPAGFEWPPEVDIMENFSSTVQITNSNFGPGGTVLGNIVPVDVTTYHTYGLKWTSTQLIWYIDGVVKNTENVAASVPHELMYVVLNLAVRNTNVTPHTMDVDYVRAWQ